MTGLAALDKLKIPVNHIHFRGVETRVPIPRRVAQEADLSRPSSAIITRPIRESRKELDPFVAWLLRRAGISAEGYRSNPMERRLPSCLRELRLATPEAARLAIEAKPELLPVALNSMLIGVTSFFRDAAVFDALEREVLPTLLQSRNGLRALSIGVSDGQELFSVAMLLAEAGVLANSSLLGVDCRPDAIERGKAGLFAEIDMTGLSIERRSRFFKREGAGWRVAAEIAAAIQWCVDDLFSFSPPTSDLILFRNVAIYLEEEPMQLVWEKLCYALSPGGYLITGKAEKPLGSLPLSRVAASVYQKL